MKTIKFIGAILSLAVLVAASAAQAQAPIPTGQTPTLYGGERLAPGTFVMGATTGYPETSFDLYWGLAERFDLALQVGFTYGHNLSGIRQRLGMDAHVPLRWTLLQKSKVAGGLRVSPYFMIGEGSPSISTGGDVAFLIDIALPKIFKIIVGPEVRTGFTSIAAGGNGFAGYDGGAWANVGIETLLVNKFHLGVMFHGGGQWGTNGLGGGGIFRGQIYFGGTM